VVPVEILPIQENIILRAGGSELLILAAHVRKLQDLKNPRDFSQYFRGEALVNRPARKLFEAWLRKDQTLWPRIYKSVQGITLSESTTLEGEVLLPVQDSPREERPDVLETPVLKSPEATPTAASLVEANKNASKTAPESELVKATAKPKSKKTAPAAEEKPKATKKDEKNEVSAKTKNLEAKPKSTTSKSVPKETGKVKKKG
jgi:hypothetical protein